MPTRDEIERNIAALQEQLANADTGDEVWVKDGDHEVKISGKRATTILNKFSKLWEDEGGDEGDGADDADAGGEPKREGLFKSRGKQT